MAIDLFELGDTPENLAKALQRSSCRWLLMSFTSDWLFPPFQSQEIVDSLIAGERPVSYCNVQTDCGHDAFLLPNQLDIYGELIRAFLANLGADIVRALPESTDSELAATTAEGTSLSADGLLQPGHT